MVISVINLSLLSLSLLFMRGTSVIFLIWKRIIKSISVIITDITSTLTAIILLHYWVANKMALEISGYADHVQDSTMIIGEPTT